MVNKVILVGNVGKDPEVRHLESGASFARFTLATSESYKDKEGNRVTNTEWHNIVLWRGLAEIAEKYVKKGSKLYIEGKITNRSYEQDGATKYFTEIVGNEMKMLDSRNAGDTGSSPSSNAEPASNSTNTAEEPLATDDLPF
jgi:single-strand DNA-binding protein